MTTQNVYFLGLILRIDVRLEPRLFSVGILKVGKKLFCLSLRLIRNIQNGNHM